MTFALDHADCALQISVAIGESIREPGAPPPILVARLYVAADVLHNCATPGVKNASIYRTSLQVSRVCRWSDEAAMHMGLRSLGLNYLRLWSLFLRPNYLIVSKHLGVPLVPLKGECGEKQ